MPRTKIETAEFVIASLNDLGIEPHPSSRLMQMRNALDATGVIAPDHPDFETALEAQRDMQLLAFGLEQKHAKSGHAGFKQLLYKLTNDSVLPQQDRQQSRGRDTQFELFVGAICQAAGFFPVEYPDPPDVMCYLDGVTIGVEAKRIKSEGQVKKRIPKAAKQIHGSGIPGVIALDTCLALNPGNTRITTPIPDKIFARNHCTTINLFVRRHIKRIRSWVSGKGVIGIIVHDHQVRCEIDNSWSLSSMTMRLPLADAEHSKRLFNTFATSYVDVQPNMQHL